jgi:hypothetical protein
MANNIIFNILNGEEPFYGQKLFSNYVKVYIMSSSFKTENDVVLRAFSLKLCNLLTFGLFPISFGLLCEQVIHFDTAQRVEQKGHLSGTADRKCDSADFFSA